MCFSKREERTAFETISHHVFQLQNSNFGERKKRIPFLDDSRSAIKAVNEKPPQKEIIAFAQFLQTARMHQQTPGITQHFSCDRVSTNWQA